MTCWMLWLARCYGLLDAMASWKLCLAGCYGLLDSTACCMPWLAGCYGLLDGLLDAMGCQKNYVIGVAPGAWFLYVFIYIHMYLYIHNRRVCMGLIHQTVLAIQDLTSFV